MIWRLVLLWDVCASLLFQRGFTYSHEFLRYFYGCRGRVAIFPYQLKKHLKTWLIISVGFENSPGERAKHCKYERKWNVAFLMALSRNLLKVLSNIVTRASPLTSNMYGISVNRIWSADRLLPKSDRWCRFLERKEESRLTENYISNNY